MKEQSLTEYINAMCIQAAREQFVRRERIKRMFAEAGSAFLWLGLALTVIGVLFGHNV